MDRGKRGKRRVRSGFTLLEVLFTVLIVTILAAIAIPFFNNAGAEGQLQACRKNIRAIASAESKFRFDNDIYTETGTDLVEGYGLAKFPGCPKGGALGVYTLTVDSGTGACTITCGHHAGNTMVLQ